jgi:hypothetical protein
VGFSGQTCDARRHLLASGTGFALETKYNFVSAEQADATFRSTVVQHLFRYEGAKARARLWVHMRGRIQAGTRKDTRRGSAQGHDQDLPSHIMLRLPNTSELGLGNTIENFGKKGNVPYLSLMSAMKHYGNWDESEDDSGLHVDFDLVPGDYQLVLYNDCWIQSKRDSYGGWNSATQTLTFKQATLELVF